MADAWSAIFLAVPGRVGAIMGDLVVPLGVAFGLIIAGAVISLIRGAVGGGD